MKRSPLWQRGMILLLSFGVGVLAQTEDTGAPTTANSGHANIDCAVCHSLVASLDETVVSISPTQQCQSCHSLQGGKPAGLASVFHNNPNRSCGDCHLFHDPGMISVSGNVFAPGQSAGPEVCSACHDGGGSMGNLSEGHRLAAALYHSNDPALAGLSASESCLLCHADGVSAPIAGLDVVDVPRFYRHKMHPVGDVTRRDQFRNGVRQRRVFDPRIQLFDNRIECHTCHQLTGITKNRLLDLGSPEALCLACHEFE